MSLRTAAIRLVTLVAVLLAVSFLTFTMLNVLGGDPALSVVGADNADPETLAKVRAELGLDKSFLEQYGDWVGGVVQGDLGRSFKTKQPVTEAIGERIPVTAQVGLLAIVMALLGAIPVAVYSAYRAGSRVDQGVSTATFGLLSIPNFLLAYWLG